jgi:hypothetical protein
MSVVRTLALLLVYASLCAAGQPRTFIRIQQHPPPEYHSCFLYIVAVDGKVLRSPQRQISLPPGQHRLSIRVRLISGGALIHADAPLEQSFKPHHYWLDGEMLKGGLFHLIIQDEDERPPGVKPPKTR